MALQAAFAIVSGVFPQVALSIRVPSVAFDRMEFRCQAINSSARVHSVVTFTNGFVLAYLKGI